MKKNMIKAGPQPITKKEKSIFSKFKKFFNENFLNWEM